MSDTRNLDGGYVIILRRVRTNPVFRCRRECAIFVDMVMEAQWRPAVTLKTKYGAATLGRGEVLIAERELAEEWGLARNTIRGLLERMRQDGMIEVIRDYGRCPQRAGTLVKILNYDIYQGFGEASNQRTASYTASCTSQGPQEDRIRTASVGEENQQNQGIDASFGEAPNRIRTGQGPQEDRTKDLGRTKNNQENQSSQGKDSSLRSEAAPPPSTRKTKGNSKTSKVTSIFEGGPGPELPFHEPTPASAQRPADGETETSAPSQPVMDKDQGDTSDIPDGPVRPAVSAESAEKLKKMVSYVNQQALDNVNQPTKERAKTISSDACSTVHKLVRHHGGGETGIDLAAQSIRDWASRRKAGTVSGDIADYLRGIMKPGNISTGQANGSTPYIRPESHMSRKIRGFLQGAPRFDVEPVDDDVPSDMPPANTIDGTAEELWTPGS